MHVPVLLQEVLTGLNLQANQHVVDGTLGGGGHAAALLARSGPQGLLLGCDRDADVLSATRETLSAYGDRLITIHDSYARIMEYPDALKRVQPIHGILLDLGLSSLQMDDPERGFSFRSDGLLDMRFDRRAGESAADLLNSQPEEELRMIFAEFGELPQARRLAAAVVNHRSAYPFKTTRDVVGVVEQVVGQTYRRRVHPATLVFQALRIAVNHELEQLESFLPVAVNLLAPGGRLAVISFHSLEDRIVKQFMNDAARDCVCPPELPECRCTHRATVSRVTRKPILPSNTEIDQNPRSRSAKLRLIEKLSIQSPT